MIEEGANWFKFKNISSFDNKLIITDKNTFKGASRDITYKSIPGRSGDLIIDNKRYNNAIIKYNVEVFNTEVYNLIELAYKIKNWLLAGVGYFPLYDSYDDKYYRMASYFDEVDIIETLPQVGKAIFKFNCKPFKYSKDGQFKKEYAEAFTLKNPEHFGSKPYIKITGSGDITLSVNNSSFNFTGVEEYIEIDSEIMNAFKGTLPQNHKMATPFFPVLIPGNNNISWVGTVNNVEIIPRWCCL